MEKEVRKALAIRVSELGSYAAVARQVGVSDEYVRQAAIGVRPVRGKLLTSLGFELVKTYRRLNPPPSL